mgnify:CR=1 FL=1
MEIHMNHIDPCYDQGMAWVRADGDVRCSPSPEHPENPVVVVPTLMRVPGGPQEPFVAWQPRTLDAASPLRERVVSDRRDVVPPQQPSQEQRGTF